MNKYNELIVFVIRETSWSLEYVRSIPYDQLLALTNELVYQKAVDEYKRDYPLATLLAVLTSDKNKHRKPEDFLGKSPQRKGGNTLWQKAQSAGIKIPTSPNQQN